MGLLWKTDAPQGEVPMVHLEYQEWAAETLGWYPELLWGNAPSLDGGGHQHNWSDLERDAMQVRQGRLASPSRGGGTVPLDIERRPARFGKVRLGRKVQRKITKGPRKGEMIEVPMATDHFVIDDLPEVQAVYGEEPTEFRIFFLWNDPAKTFPHFLKLYGGRRLKCLGDGNWILRRSFDAKENSDGSITPGQRIVDGVDEGTGKPVECPWRACEFYGMDGCRETGRLLFGFQEIPRLGFYEVVVHKMGVQAISGQLDAAMAVFGQIVRIPWVMKLADYPVTFDVLDERTGEMVERTRDVKIPQIEIDFQFLQKHMALKTWGAPDPFLLESGQQLAALTSAAQIEPEDMEDHEEERLSAAELREIEGEFEEEASQSDEAMFEAEVNAAEDALGDLETGESTEPTPSIKGANDFWVELQAQYNVKPGDPKVKALLAERAAQEADNEKKKGYWQRSWNFIIERMVGKG